MKFRLCRNKYIVICISLSFILLTYKLLITTSKIWLKVLPKKSLKDDFNPKKSPKHEKFCPEIPLGLLGEDTIKKLEENFEDFPNFNEIAAANPQLSEGGHHSPKDCRARNRVAIIIPLRGREFQLRGLLSHMHPIWQRQQMEYTVYTITQAGKQLFNRAKLMNVGFAEAMKDRRYDCFAFHDVDILLENDHCLYHCSDKRNEVKHMSAFLDKFNYELRKYETKCLPAEFPESQLTIFGGIVMMSQDQFQDLNGFSNIFWGWGGEDDDMALRVWKKGYKVVRDDKCRYRMLKHETEGRYRNGLKNRIHNSTFARQGVDGLNTLSYKIISMEKNQLFTNITVDVGSPSSEMLRMMNDKWEKRKCDGSDFLNSKIIW